MFKPLFSLTIVALTIGLSQTDVISKNVTTLTNEGSQKLAHTQQSGPFRVNVSSLEAQLATA